MNATTLEDDGQVTAQGPGGRLKAIREAQELQLERVAVLLHLSEQKLIALEADDYRELSGSVFVKGYIRNYARLLGAPSAPLLEAYDAFKPGNERQANLRMSQVRHEVRSSHVIIRLMTWVIVIGLIALVVVWWRGYLQWPLQADDTAEPAEIVQNDMGDAQPVSLGTDGLPPIPSPETEESSLQSEAPLIESRSFDTDVIREQVTEETAPVSELVEVEDSSPVITPDVEESSAPDLAENAHTVEVVFSAPCWVDIKDATGRFRLFGKKEAGERHLLGGKPPYRVVLGNARAVKITVDNEAFDLDAHTRGKVARFSLNPE